jgi:hypothetical protein
MKCGLVAVGLAATLVCASCASVPAKGKVPDWIFSNPEPDATNTYFVASASDSGGDIASATNDAAANLLASITQYIGVKVAVSSDAQAKATLDSYSANIESTVTSSSTNQVAGFTVKERYVQKDAKTKRITVYILASYITTDLESEKSRIQKAFQERIDAVGKPEAEGHSLESDGRVYEAVRKYIEAAVAASGSDIDNAELKLERNVNNARSALARLNFDASASSGYKGLVGQVFPKPLAAKLVSGEGVDAQGVAGAIVLVTYQRKAGSGLAGKTESVMTDASGGISFTPPVPDFVGKARFTLKLDFQSSIELLDNLPEKYASYRDSLVEELRAKSLELPYEVISAAKSVPMAVAIVDIDENGQAQDGAKAQAGLIEALLREKFNVNGIAVTADALIALDESAAAEAAKAAGSYERIAFGAARMTDVRKDGENYLATAKASVKVLDVASGRVLYQAERGVTGLGADEQSARASAYRELGLNTIAKDLLANLP